MLHLSFGDCNFHHLCWDSRQTQNGPGDKAFDCGLLSIFLTPVFSFTVPPASALSIRFFCFFFSCFILLFEKFFEIIGFNSSSFLIIYSYFYHNSPFSHLSTFKNLVEIIFLSFSTFSVLMQKIAFLSICPQQLLS